MDNENNNATVTGLLSKLVEDHAVRGEKFYVGQIKCPRLSGNEDLIPVTIPEKLLGLKRVEEILGPITVRGQIRSYNKIVDGGSRLSLTLFAQDFGSPEAGAPRNHVTIEGVICRAPNFRVTPFGREICDLMIAVPRRYSKGDYVPSIVWGRDGRWASTLRTGDRVVITGRFQSRDYEKLLDNGESEKRTVHEISAFNIARATEETRTPA